METTRRGFIGTVAALVALPGLVKLTPEPEPTIALSAKFVESAHDENFRAWHEYMDVLIGAGSPNPTYNKPPRGRRRWRRHNRRTRR